MWYNFSVLNVFSSIFVLLSYKRKILLLSPDIDPTGIQQHLWCLIGGEDSDPGKYEEVIYRKVKYATKLDLKNLKLLRSSSHKKNKHFYHTELTDNEVNSIERREGQRLEFFTLPELSKLSLTKSTEGYINEYRNAVEQVLI